LPCDALRTACYGWRGTARGAIILRDVEGNEVDLFG